MILSLCSLIMYAYSLISQGSEWHSSGNVKYRVRLGTFIVSRIYSMCENSEVKRVYFLLCKSIDFVKRKGKLNFGVTIISPS